MHGNQKYIFFKSVLKTIDFFFSEDHPLVEGMELVNEFN